MKLLFTALALFSAGALACPADDAKDAQASPQDRAVTEAKAPLRAATPAKAIASKKEKAQSTKVAADTARKPSL
jgi:hypothetical protein